VFVNFLQMIQNSIVISGAEDQDTLQCDINNHCTCSYKWLLCFNIKKYKMIQYEINLLTLTTQLRILMVRTLNLKLLIQKKTSLFTLPVV